jgi:predicted alpha/beta-hydrolase family hydrolase
VRRPGSPGSDRVRNSGAPPCTVQLVPVGGERAVRAAIALPATFTPGVTPAVILAHGAGSDMDAPFLSAVHIGLAKHGFVAVKFNFPYKERGSRLPDPAPVLVETFARVLDTIRTAPGLTPPRIVVGGKSLGGRMASLLAVAEAEIAGLLFLGYPLHPAGQPERLRTAHLTQIRVPMLFFAGTRDPLCRLDLLRQATGRLDAAVTVHVIDGADHSFALPKRAARPAEEVWNEIVSESVRWLRTVMG